MAALTGGDKLMAALAAINARLASAGTKPHVDVGFLAGATYPDGKSVPMIAAVQEFGGRIEREPSDPDEGGGQTIYRELSVDGRLLHKGRFVKKPKSNYATTHYVGAYVITIPPRPYFRNMIADKGPTWGASMATLLKVTDFDAGKTLAQMGDLIKGQLQLSIKALVSPPLAESTIERKGFSKPLIETGHMWNSVDYSVSA